MGLYALIIIPLSTSGSNVVMSIPQNSKKVYLLIRFNKLLLLIILLVVGNYIG